MPTLTQMKRDALIAEVRREVPFSQLVVAIGFILQHRRERAGLPKQPLVMSAEQAERMIEEFLPTCSKRQLRMLREIANGVESETIPIEQAPPVRGWFSRASRT